MSPAQALRDASDPQAVADLVARFPSPESIGGRRLFDPTWALEKLPRDPTARLTAVETRITEQREHNTADHHRYDDLRARGLAALSDYDITISSGGRPLEALHCALQLKTNHITYGHSTLLALESERAALLDAIERNRPPQLALF